MLLLHGLFSGSGFWLENLKKLKDYKIILCDIDYEFFFREDKHCIRQLEDYVANKKNLTIVSHSFGSSLNAWLDKSFLRINICPILANSRTNTNLFISEIKKRTNYRDEDIITILKNAEEYLKKYNNFLSKSSSEMINFIPNNDCFFNYNCVSNFKGDHFDISYALNEIMNLDELN